MATVVLGLVGGAGFAAAWAIHAGPWTRADAVNAEAPPTVLEVGKSTSAPHVAVAPVAAELIQAPDAAAERLTAARFEALARGDGDALVALTAQGTPARTEAEGTAAALRDRLLSVDGLEGSVEDAVTLGAATDSPRLGSSRHTPPGIGATAVVRLRYRVGPHDVVARGKTTTYDGYEQTVDLTLTWVEGTGWLVSDARPATTSGS